MSADSVEPAAADGIASNADTQLGRPSGVGGTRSIVVSSAFVLSGLTSFVALVAAKRSLSAVDFGSLSIFWSFSFFVSALATTPVEQELSRSAAVQIELGMSTRPEILTAARTTFFAATSLITLAALVLVGGMLSAIPGAGITLAVALLVVGESVGALVRGDAAARRDATTLAIEVAGHGLVRGAAAATVAVATRDPVAVCLAVAAGGAVPAVLLPRLLWRDMPAGADGGGPMKDPPGTAFSTPGVIRLALGVPPRALFAIGTPLLAALVGRGDETAAIGDVLAALSITSAPVLVAVALQATLIPQFAIWRERGERARTRTRLQLISSSVTGLTAVATVIAGTLGPWLLDLVYGSTPFVGRGALATMTAGAGLLFLANVLMPALIAAHRYTTISLAWILGAVALVATAMAPGGIADRIGRAVLVGSAVVNLWLLWGLRTCFRRCEPAEERPTHSRPSDSGE